MPNLALLVLVVGLLTACTADGGSDSTSTSGDTSTTTVARDTTTTTGPEATTTTQQPSAGGPDCLVGTWTLDTEAFVTGLADIFADSGVEAENITALDGSYTIELSPGGSLSGVRDEWGFSIATSEGTFVIRISGTESGTWSADDEMITVDIPTSDMTVQASIEADGQAFEIPSSPVDIPEAIAASSDYTCDGDVLSITSDGITSVMRRS